MKRIKTLLTLVSVIAMLMSLFVAPASASPGAGEVAFTCTANLPNFPAPPNTPGGTCTGTAAGALVTSTGQQVPATGAFHAEFTYTEPAATCPAQGSAAGTFTITTPAGTISGQFSWVRVGATAAIEIFDVDGGGLTDGIGRAAAAFESPQAVSNCLAGGGSLTATVAGTAVVADNT